MKIVGKHTFANPKAKVNGEVINYEVREIDVRKVDYTVTTTVGENGEVVMKTNAHKPDFTSATSSWKFTKPWIFQLYLHHNHHREKVEVKSKQLAKTGVENDMSAMLVSTNLLGAAAVLRRKKLTIWNYIRL